MTMDTQVPGLPPAKQKGPLSISWRRQEGDTARGLCLTWGPTESSGLSVGLRGQGWGARSNLQWGKWFGDLWEDGDFIPSPGTNSDLLPLSADLLVGAYGADKVAVYR